MGGRLQERPLGRHRRRVRAERHPGQADLLAHVLLGHQEEHDADARPVLEHQVEDRVLGAPCRAPPPPPPASCPVSGFSASFLKPTSSSRSGEPASRHRFSQPSPGVLHLLEDARARLAGSREALGSASGQPPSRPQGGMQASNPVAPAVYVYMSAVIRSAVPPRRLDPRDHLVHLRPVRLARRLQVVDLGGQPRLAADADQLVDAPPAAGRPRCACARCTCPRSAPRPCTARSAPRSTWNARARRSATSRCRARPPPSRRARARASRPARAGVGGRSSRPITCSRIGGRADERGDVRRDALPLEVREVLGERRPARSRSACRPARAGIRCFISAFSGPYDQPSPKISVVTPWRMSPCERASTSSDSVAHDSMLMKPGATASPLASITSRALAAASSPTAAMRSPRRHRSAWYAGPPVPS